MDEDLKEYLKETREIREQKLYDYVQKVRKEGKSNKEIKDKLLGMLWKNEDIDAALAAKSRPVFISSLKIWKSRLKIIFLKINSKKELKLAILGIAGITVLSLGGWYIYKITRPSFYQQISQSERDCIASTTTPEILDFIKQGLPAQKVSLPADAAVEIVPIDPVINCFSEDTKTLLIVNGKRALAE